jgi:hypothetical protein
MAANLNYNVNVNTNNAIQSLNNLQTKVSGLNSVFGGLKNAIAGIAIGQVLSSVIKVGDGLKDLSDSTGIATTEILGFQRAVSLFGGSSEGATKGLLRLVGNIGEAADGSASLQSAFAKVGVSLSDLATLSERDILVKVVQGLEGINDKSTQAALKTQLLGKEFRNVSTSGLSEAFAKSAEESQRYADSIERAAQLQESLDLALEKVKLTLLEMIGPFAELINSMDQEKILGAVEGFTRLAAVLTTLYGFGKVIAIVEGLTVGLAGVAGAALTFGLNLAKAFILPVRIAAALFAAFEGLKIIAPDTAKKIGDT